MKTKLKINKKKKLQIQPKSSKTDNIKQGSFKTKFEIVETDSTNEISIKSPMGLSSTIKAMTDANQISKKKSIKISKKNFKFEQQYSQIDSGEKKREFQLSNSKQKIEKAKNVAIIPSTQYEAYSKLLGIDRLQPEILLLLNFLPLYKTDGDMTKAGKYFSAQAYIRNLKTQMMIHTLIGYSSANSSVRGVVQSEFAEAIDSLWSHIEFLYGIVDNFEKIKMSLNVSRRTNDINIEDVAFKLIDSLSLVSQKKESELSSIQNTGGFGKSLSVFDSSNISSPSKLGIDMSSPLMDSLNSNSLLPSVQTLPAKRNLVDLLKYYKYDEKSISKFHSTKVWGQVMIMIRNILVAGTSHTRDIHKLSQYMTDNSQTRVVGSLEYDKIREGVKNLKANSNSIETAVTKAEQFISDDILSSNEELFISLDGINLSQFNSTPEMIAEYVSFLSREIRYSSLLDDSSTSILQNNFGVSTQDFSDQGNQKIFDSIFGVKFGDTYMLMGSNPNKTTPGGSLTGLSYATPSMNTLVATFEDSYIKTTHNGTFTPGTEYYIESVFDTIENGQFRVDRLDILKSNINNINSSFISLVNEGNLLSQYDPVRDTTNHKISNPEFFISSIMNEIVDSATGRIHGKYLEDTWVPLFSYAVKDYKIQAYLFTIILYLLDPSGSNSSKFVINDILNKMFHRIESIHGAVLDSSVLDEKSQKSGNLAVPHKNGLTEAYVIVDNQGTFRPSMFESNSKTTSSFVELVLSLISSFVESSSSFTTKLSSGVGTSKQPGQFIETTTVKKTKYSGFSDIVIAAVIFKMMCHVSDQFIENKIKGSTKKDVGKNVYSYIVAMYEDKTFRTARSDLIEFVKNDVSITRECLLTLLGSLNIMSTTLSSGFGHIVNDKNLSKAKALSEVIDSKILYKLLLDSAQLRLISVDAYELKDRATSNISEEKVNSILDMNPASLTFLRCLSAVFKKDEFKVEKGFNKKILSVGIPNGMASSLEFTKTIEAGEDDVDFESDIVKVKVYKKDLEYPNIIFEPKEFLFELSRFTIEDDSKIKNITNESSFYDVMKNTPTRDINTFRDVLNLVVEYGKDLGESNIQVSAGSLKPGQNYNSRSPFMSSKYSFLTISQKQEIIQNHVMSFMLTLYMSILTGMDIDERKFVFSQNDIHQLSSNMLDLRVKKELLNVGLHVAKNGIKTEPDSFGKFESIPGSFFTAVSESDLKTKWKIDPGSQDSSINNGLSETSDHAKYSEIDASNKLSESGVKNVEADAPAAEFIGEYTQTVQDIDSLVTKYTSKISLLKKYLYPRKFERVFNIVIDSDDFFINEKATIKSAAGREALKQLSSEGSVSENGSLASNYSISFASKNYFSNLRKMKSKEKKEGDFSFEKYFVVIESLRDK